MAKESSQIPRAAYCRVAHIALLWREVRWKRWLGLCWSLVGIFAIIRDEFWMPTDINKWRVIKMIPHISLEKWVIGALAIVIVGMFEASYKAIGKLASRLETWEETSPLQIVFDARNPSRRFWSMESAKPKDGPAKAYWEYRVEIRNNSPKTLRNVSVTTEHLGQMSIRPLDKPFDKTKQPTCDLKPGCTELVPVIWWPIPIRQAGMLAGETALEYGPVKIIASADDTVSSVRMFQFDYQVEPMLFDETRP